MGKEFTDKNSILLRPVKEVSPKTMQKKSGKQFGGGGKGGKRSPLPSYYLQKVFNQTVPSTVSTKTPASKCKTPRQVHHPMGENFGSKMFAPPSLSSSQCARFLSTVPGSAKKDNTSVRPPAKQSQPKTVGTSFDQPKLRLSKQPLLKSNMSANDEQINASSSQTEEKVMFPKKW